MQTKSTRQTRRTLIRKNAILLAIAALALSGLPASRADMPLCGEDLTWINPGTGDWFDPLNWIDDFGFHGVPICPSPAFISNSGTAQISTPTPTARACQLILGKNSGQLGNLIVDHGTLETCHEILVGNAGKGILRIQNGGLVSTVYDAAIGVIAYSNGVVTVDGTNPDGRTSTWTVSGPLYVGGYGGSQGGTGLLTVTDQAGVTADSVYLYKSGTLTGNGTVTTNNGATTIEGTLAPSGGTFTFNGDVFWRDSAVTDTAFPRAVWSTSWRSRGQRGLTAVYQ